MGASSLALFLATQLAFAGVASTAFATEPTDTRAAGAPVQPVPYTQSQPVPYAAPAQAAPAASTASGTIGSAGNDVVVLKSGGMVRGTLIEILPNDHATVQLATGQNAIIQWDHIHHIERGGAAPTAAPAAAAPSPASEGPTARVHIEAERAVTIERHVSGKEWAWACTAPCDADLPIAREYRIVGEGVRTSAPFHLGARAGEHIAIVVNVSSKGAFAGGIVLTVVGGITLLVGACIALVGLEENSIGNTFSGGNSNAGDSAVTAGLITLAIGALGTLSGIVLMVGNKSSTVEQEPMQARGAAPAPEAWRRLPTWHEDNTALAAPKTTSIPIFRGSF